MRGLSLAVLGVGLLSAVNARADTVALVPPLSAGGAGTPQQLNADIAAGARALKHDLANDKLLKASLGTIEDGKADTPAEYDAVGQATGADWVIAGSVDPAVDTARVELWVYRTDGGRLESVAREVDNNQRRIQIQEMLAVILRPEGVGVGALPWEGVRPPDTDVAAPPPPPPPVGDPPPPAPPPPPAVPEGPAAYRMTYLADEAWVDNPYQADGLFYLSGALGASVAVGRPDGAQGSGAAMTAAIAFGLAPIDGAGLELGLELGGNVVGPRAGWMNLAARYMFTPVRGDRSGFAWHIGPEVRLGGFLQLGESGVAGPNGQQFERDAAVSPLFGASLASSVYVTKRLALQLSLGDLRFVPVEQGSLVLVGANGGAVYRF